MSNITCTTKRIGGSIMVRIPKDVVEQEGIGENESIDLSVRKSRRDFFGAMPGLKPWTKADKLRSKYE